jgi:hypothetical protein
MVLELAGRYQIAGATMGALLRTDVVFDEDGAERGLGPKTSGVLTMFFTSAVGARAVRFVAAMGGAFAKLTDGLQLVLDLGQPAAEVGVLRLHVGDPLLQGGDEDQESGLGLGWDRVPEGWWDRRLSCHTLYYDASVQRVRPCDGSGRRKNPEQQATNRLTVTLPGQ